MNESNNCLKQKHFSVRSEILKYASRYKISAFFIILITMAESAVTIVCPRIAGNVVDMLSVGVELINLHSVLKTLLILLVLYSVYAFSSCLKSYIMSVMGVRITYELRENISKKISKLSLIYLDSTQRGDVLSRIVNDVETVSEAFTQGISRVISSIILMIGMLYMMFYISWQMAGISIFFIPLAALATLLIVKKSQKYFVRYQEGIGNLNGYIEEVFSGYETVKVYNATLKTEKKFHTFNNCLYDSSVKAQFLSSLSSPITEIVSSLSFICICVLGGYFVVLEMLTLGDISAFLAYSAQFMSPLIQVLGIMSVFQHTSAAFTRITDFLNAREEKNSLKSVLIAPRQGNIVFENVSFSYEDNKPAVENISFEVPRGSSVAIVGETGAGKTTLIKLLMRFYEPSEGNILLNGIDIKDFGLHDYRKMFALVTQEPWLYHATIAENIRYGNTKATTEQVKKAAEFVGADHFIKTFPLGYQTVVDELGSNISEGEKQLIALARAVLADSAFLILDEATSSVDLCTENRIQNAIRTILKDKTSFIIAHRISTIKNADIIIVMHKGKVAQLGTHAQLLSQDGIYRDLQDSCF